MVKDLSDDWLDVQLFQHFAESEVTANSNLASPDDIAFVMHSLRQMISSSLSEDFAMFEKCLLLFTKSNPSR